MDFIESLIDDPLRETSGRECMAVYNVVKGYMQRVLAYSEISLLRWLNTRLQP